MKCPNCHSENPETKQFCGDCGTQLIASEKPEVSVTRTIETTSDALTRGMTFAGRYEIIEELGAGGMGRVYRAHDTKLNEEVALKLIKPEIAADKRTVERFHNEIKVARKIRHKNVCGVYDFHEEGKALFLTMEYVRGEDLKSLIHRTKVLSVGTALAIARQIAEGLAEAHKLGITHRDLKPGNIMIDKDGQAKVMDFGIARSLRGAGITGEGAIIGTPEYMSPEQVEGKEADQRADIYALGIILFEMVTGRVPFEGETPFSIANKQKSEPPPVPKKLAPQIPEGLSRLILRCLEKDKAKRYQTAEDLIADIAAVEESLPTAERVAPRRKTITHREVTVKFEPRKLVMPVLVISALVIISVFLWHPWSKSGTFTPPPKIENSIAVISFRNQTGDKAYDYLCHRAMPDLLITNLENTGYFYVAPWERMIDLLKQMGKNDITFIDNDLGFELCRREGISSIILGSLNKAGDTFVTDVKLLDAENKKLLKGIQSKGKGEDSILDTQIDELSRDILKGMGIGQEKVEATRLIIADVTTSSMEAYKFYIEGMDFFDKYKFNEAKTSFEKAIQIDSSFASAYRRLATVYTQLRDYKARENAITKAKSLSDKVTEKEKLKIEAQTAGYQGDKEKFIHGQEEIIKKYPRDKEAHFWLGLYISVFAPNVMMKDLGRGIKEMEKVLELDPNYAEAYEALGSINNQLGNFEKAIELYNKYKSQSPGNANAFDGIGAVYFSWGKLDEAIANYKKAINMNPHIYTTYWSLACALALKENYPEAMDWINRLLETDPPQGIQGTFFFIRAFLNLWLARFEQSLLDSDRAEKLSISLGREQLHAQTEWVKGVVHFERGEFGLSQKHWGSYLDLSLKAKYNNPSFENFNYAQNDYLLGLIDLMQGMVGPAKTKLYEIRTYSPEIVVETLKEMMTYLYDILDVEICIREGKVDSDKVLKVFGKDRDFGSIFINTSDYMRYIDMISLPPLARDTVPRAYLQKGELDKAISAYERLVTFNPQSKDRRLIHPLNHYHLGKVYEQKGDKRKAQASYQKFLDLWKDADPGLPEVEDAKKRLASLKK